MSNQAKRLSGCPAERLAHCRGEDVQPAGDVEVLINSLDRFESEGEDFVKLLDVRDVTAMMRSHVTRLNAEVSALQQRLNIADQRVCDLQTELTKVRELSGLSAEAFSVMQGMVEHCLNVRACMGMDEGFNDFDTEEEHDFVKELRAFLAHQSAPAEKSEHCATCSKLNGSNYCDCERN